MFPRLNIVRTLGPLLMGRLTNKIDDILIYEMTYEYTRCTIFQGSWMWY